MTTYVWTAKEKQWKYWPFISVWLRFEDLKNHVNEKGYVNIIVSPRKEVGKYWDTHTVSIDEYVPKAKEDTQEPEKKYEKIEEIPF